MYCMEALSFAAVVVRILSSFFSGSGYKSIAPGNFDLVSKFFFYLFIWDSSNWMPFWNKRFWKVLLNIDWSELEFLATLELEGPFMSRDPLKVISILLNYIICLCNRSGVTTISDCLLVSQNLLSFFKSPVEIIFWTKQEKNDSCVSVYWISDLRMLTAKRALVSSHSLAFYVKDVCAKKYILALLKKHSRLGYFII